MLEWLFWASAGLIAYVYAGYPLLLAALRVSRRERRADVGSAVDLPAVTQIISAYNEAGTIGEKLKNSLAVDYPPDLFEVIVVSDASDDGTDEIVRRFGQDPRVRLLRMETRGGKTVGLNAAVPRAKGEIIVFSDANAMYGADAIRRLVEPFSDQSVGAVTGESRYRVDAGDAATGSENLYWRYELLLKRLESEVGGLVGGDGAIYAIRKSLYKPLNATDLSDFVNPLQVVVAGYRNVYQPEAYSYERGGETFAKEFRRKVRIVNRAWRGMMSMRQVLNPFRFGFFSIQAISHKLLRWLVPMFMIIALICNIAIVGRSQIYLWTLAAQVLFYLAALGGALSADRRRAVILYGPYYFCLINIASLIGIAQHYLGYTYTTWSTVRDPSNVESGER